MNAVRCRARVIAGFGDYLCVSRAPFYRRLPSASSSHTEPHQSLKTHAIANFAIEPYASPQPNSRGENLNLRYNLAKRSVELLLRVCDEI